MADSGLCIFIDSNIFFVDSNFQTDPKYCHRFQHILWQISIPLSIYSLLTICWSIYFLKINSSKFSNPIFLSKTTPNISIPWFQYFGFSAAWWCWSSFPTKGDWVNFAKINFDSVFKPSKGMNYVACSLLKVQARACLKKRNETI